MKLWKWKKKNPNQNKPKKKQQFQLWLTENFTADYILFAYFSVVLTVAYYSSLALFFNCAAHWWRKFKSNFNIFVQFQLIKTAEKWAIRSSHNGEYVQIVLCTCSAAGSQRIKEACNNVFQCIVDECGMCLEPETLIPIVSSKAKQVVLIGDHKQLQPIVKNRVARSLGLSTSMFERFSDHALLLEEQYRMVNWEMYVLIELQASICNETTVVHSFSTDIMDIVHLKDWEHQKLRNSE